MQNATGFSAVTAIRIDFAQQLQVCTRFGRILATLHLAIDDTTILTFAGDMMHLGDKAGILFSKQYNLSFKFFITIANE